MRSLDICEDISSILSTDHEDDALQSTWPDGDVLRGVLVHDDGDWTDDDMTLDNDADVEVEVVKRSAAVDNLLAHYFGEVRRYALLSFPEEQALGRRINRWKKRVRYALYCSATALPTLLGLWHRVEREELPLARVVRQVGKTAHEQAKQRSQVEATLQCLQGLAVCLGRHTRQPRASVLSAQERQSLQHRRVRLWRQWCTGWETLGLHATVFETLRSGLHLAYQRQSDDQALQRVVQALGHAEHQLELAKAQMLQANLRLVIHVANRYRSHGVPLLDLIQEGNIGLMRALDKFEPQRGLKFVTYAHWWIRQAVSRALIEQHRTVRLPSHIVERKHKLRRVGNRLWYAYGRAPNVQELSDELAWTPQEVEELRTTVQPISRLHQPIADDGSLLADVVEDDHAVKPEALIAEDQLHQRLDTCLTRLPEREAYIIRLRYGIDTDHEHTLQEIADKLGISRERVRQLERLAFEKLRQPQQSKVLADFAHVA